MPTIRLVRQLSFSAAHRYFAPDLSEAENRAIYGSLYRDEGFGHNFLVEAHFEGDVDPLTGMIVNLVDVDRWLGEVNREVDHKNLGKLSWFAGVAPTPERIALYFASEISRRLPRHVRLAKVRIYEGEDLWIDVSP